LKGRVEQGGGAVYDSPSPGVGLKVFHLAPGTTVEVLESHGDFYAVKVLGRSEPLYIHRTEVDIVPQWDALTKVAEPPEPEELQDSVPPESGSATNKPLQEPFASNPFRVLRLAGKASAEDVRRRYSELQLDRKLQSKPSAESELDALVKAQSDLLDPAKRIRFEALWFYDPPGCLFDGQVPLGDAEFERYRGRAEAPGEEGVESRHDLAISLLLQATHTADIDAAQNLTARALSSLSELLDDPEYSKYAARLGVKASERTRHLIWRETISALSAAAQRSAERGANGQVGAYCRGARAYGIGTEDERNLLEPAIQVVAFALARLVDEAAKGVPPEGGGISMFDAWASKLGRNLSQAVKLHRELGETAFPELASALDAAAVLLRSTAIDLHNKRDETECAIRLIAKAKAIAASEDLRDRLTADHKTLLYQHHMGRCAALVREKRWAEAAEAAATALNAATTQEERLAAQEAVRALQTRTSGQGIGRRPAFAWLAKLAVPAVIIGGSILLRSGLGSNSSSVSPPISYPTRSAPVSSGPSLPPAPAPTSSTSAENWRLEKRRSNLDLRTRTTRPRASSVSWVLTKSGHSLGPGQHSPLRSFRPACFVR